MEFSSQAAHGGPTKMISDFTNVKELYDLQKVEFKLLDNEEVAYNTLNTSDRDMSQLMGGEISMDDKLFAHVIDRSDAKSISVHKDSGALGITLSDNGAGVPFIKNVRGGSVAADHKLKAGWVFGSLDGTETKGMRHFEVARMLKEFPIGSTFTLTYYVPLTAESESEKTRAKAEAAVAVAEKKKVREAEAAAVKAKAAQEKREQREREKAELLQQIEEQREEDRHAAQMQALKASLAAEKRSAKPSPPAKKKDKKKKKDAGGADEEDVHGFESNSEDGISGGEENGVDSDSDDGMEGFGLSKEDQLEMAYAEHESAMQAGKQIMGATATNYTVAYQEKCNEPGTAQARDAFEAVANEIKAATAGPIFTNTDPDAEQPPDNTEEGEAGAVTFYDTATDAVKGGSGGGTIEGLKYALYQPTQGVKDFKKPKAGPKFMLLSRKAFRKAMPKVDKLLQTMAFQCNALLTPGPEKNNDRWINKARISYHNNLRRVTDIARRCLICENFHDLLKLLEMLRDSNFVIIRIKNRFKKGNALAAETASYRDCQLVCFIPGTKLLFEIQLHLECIYDVKAAANNETGADNRTGHEKYILFREIKERADATLAADLKEISQLP